MDAIASTVDVLKAPHLNRRTLTREIIRALLVCIAGAETGDGDVSLATLRTLTHLSGRSTAMLRKIRDLNIAFPLVWATKNLKSRFLGVFSSSGSKILGGVCLSYCC